MALSFKLFKDFVSGAKTPRLYFRTRRSPPLILDHPIYLPNGVTTVRDLNTQVVRTDARHQYLNLIKSILLDLAPGQYCGRAHRTIAARHQEALIAVERAVHICNSRKLEDQALTEIYDNLNVTLSKVNRALKRDLAPAICNCDCDPDLSVVYDFKGNDITEEVDAMWYSLFGIHLSNLPHDEESPYNPKPNVLLDIDHTEDTDFVDHPLGFGAKRIPRWLRTVFTTLSIAGVNAECVDVEEQTSSNLEIDGPPPVAIRLEDFDWTHIDRQISTIFAVDIAEQGDFEKKPEFSTDVNSKSSDTVVYDDQKVKLFHTEKPLDYECKFLPSVPPCEFDPQVVGTVDLALDPTAYKFRLGARSHAKLDLLSRAYTFLTCDFIVKLAVRPPLGVTGKYKVVSFDANTAGAFGTTNTPPVVNQVVSRDGDYWDISAQPEFVFHVPYNTNKPVCRPSEVIAGFGLANYAKLSIPQGIAMPLKCTISVQPVNVKFYVKRRIDLASDIIQVPLSTTLAPSRTDVPISGGKVFIRNLDTNNNVFKISVFLTNPNTEVATLMDAGGLGNKVVINVPSITYTEGRQLYIQEEGTVGRVQSASFILVANAEDVILQGTEPSSSVDEEEDYMQFILDEVEPIVDVDFQSETPKESKPKKDKKEKELLGTENVSSADSDFKENYGVKGNKVQAPTGQAKVDVPAERKIFVPVKTVTVTAPATGLPLFTYKVHPRNFGLSGNAGAYLGSHASLEAERFVYFGPSVESDSSSFCTVKFTSVANAYTNARLLIAAIPPGVTEPVTVQAASQFPRCYHVLHGGETEFAVPWQSPLPIELTTGSVAPSLLQVWLLENTTVAGQGTPQLTMWVSADGLKYSVPRIPTNLTTFP